MSRIIHTLSVKVSYVVKIYIKKKSGHKLQLLKRDYSRAANPCFLLYFYDISIRCKNLIPEMSMLEIALIIYMGVSDKTKQNARHFSGHRYRHIHVGIKKSVYICRMRHLYLNDK